MKALPAYPSLYQVNTRVWLSAARRFIRTRAFASAVTESRCPAATPQPRARPTAPYWRPHHSPCNSKIHRRSRSGPDGVSSNSNNPEKMDDNTWVANVSEHSGRKSLVARLRSLSAMLATLVLAGCATTYPMMPTPVLYTGARARSLFTGAPAEALAPPLDLLFFTDRAAAPGGEETDPYTAERSRSMAFGSTTVLFGEGLTWDTLVRDSLVFPRKHSVDLALGPTKELGRFPSIPYEVTMTERGLTRSAAVVDEHEAAVQGLQARDRMRARLLALPDWE
jgi:hypothetical protein